MKFNMTAKQVAEDFECSPKTVKKWARLDKVPAMKVGNAWRFNRESIISSFGNKFAKSL